MTTIATAMHDQTTADLWVDLIWLQDQPATDENVASYNAILHQLQVRAERVAYLQDHFE